jgi:hypothetical protein
MFLFDPLTGETLTKPRNEDDKITIDACKEAIKLLKEMQGEHISFEVRNTRDEYGTEEVTAKCATLADAKEALKDTADWYRELGTGRIYKITQKMRFTKVKQTLVYRR